VFDPGISDTVGCHSGELRIGENTRGGEWGIFVVKTVNSNREGRGNVRS